MSRKDENYYQRKYNGMKLLCESNEVQNKKEHEVANQLIAQQVAALMTARKEITSLRQMFAIAIERLGGNISIEIEELVKTKGTYSVKTFIDEANKKVDVVMTKLLLDNTEKKNEKQPEAEAPITDQKEDVPGNEVPGLRSGDQIDSADVGDNEAEPRVVPTLFVREDDNQEVR
jgi:hypothetical protein